MIHRLFYNHLEETIGIIVCSILFLIVAFCYKKFPPKKINHLYGFRTRRTMANQEIWDVANHRAANDMCKYSIILTIVGILILILDVPHPMIVFLIVLFVGLAISIWATYKYVDSHFNENGNKK